MRPGQSESTVSQVLMVCHAHFLLHRKKHRGRARFEDDDDETTLPLEEPRKGKRKFISKELVSSSESSEDEKPQEVSACMPAA